MTLRYGFPLYHVSTGTAVAGNHLWQILRPDVGTRPVCNLDIREAKESPILFAKAQFDSITNAYGPVDLPPKKGLRLFTHWGIGREGQMGALVSSPTCALRGPGCRLPRWLNVEF